MLSIPSVQHRRAFEAALQHVVDLGRAQPGLATNPHPIPVYLLALREVVGNEKPLTAAKLACWRFFAENTSGQVVAGDVSSGLPAKVNALIYGEAATTLLKTALSLNDMPEVRRQPHDLRILRIPGGLVNALWVKPATGGNGFCVLLGRDIYAQGDERRRYDTDTLLRDIVSPAARRILESSDQPKARRK